jgi:sodium transport system ATP-binding protein
MIVASELCKTFQVGEESRKAVQGISFEVQTGSVFGLLGPNGAGKTTTLRMIMGLLMPDSGFATVDGLRTDSQNSNQGYLWTSGIPVLAKLGMISTNDGLYPWLSVREMLSYFADLYGVDVQIARSRIEQLSNTLDIRSILDQRCSTLSTGQKQRVTFARGLMHDRREDWTSLEAGQFFSLLSSFGHKARLFFFRRIV